MADPMKRKLHCQWRENKNKKKTIRYLSSIALFFAVEHECNVNAEKKVPV